MTSTETAARYLAQGWGLTATLKPLDGEQDANFHARSDDGREFVFKIMHVGCDPNNLDFQVAALRHLEGVNADLPRIVPDLTGAAVRAIDIEGQPRQAWLLGWCEGRLLAHAAPHTAQLGYSFGSLLARVTNGLDAFRHPHMEQGHRWELTRAGDNAGWVNDIEGECCELARDALERFDRSISPRLKDVPWAVVHNDANDYNVLVSGQQVSGLIDFGDLSWQPVICDVAIALAYYLLDKDDPLSACVDFLRGYQAERPLSVDEVAVLYDLITVRLSVSLAISSHRQKENPEDPYITISQAPARRALLALSKLSPQYAEAVFRHACGFPAVAQAERVHRWLSSNELAPAAVIAVDQYLHCLDLSIGSPMLGADPANAELAALTELIANDMQSAQVSHAFGRYAEARGIYGSPQFGGTDYPTRERRTEHLGIDIFCDVGEPVYAPIDGVVEMVTINDAPLDYGPLVILTHTTPDGDTFHTLYGHLSALSIKKLSVGQRVTSGEAFARVGHDDENGGWTPHLHFQIIMDLLGLGADFPGVIRPSERAVWHLLCPNPALLMPCDDPERFDASPDTASLLERRSSLLGGNLSLSYARPLNIVRGFGQFLYDEQARAYLDAYNNVAHVGHCHPRVVAAVQQQTALLNTNTRYLHHHVLDYAERLVARLPDPLSVCYFVNSASEANELSLRLARIATGRNDMLVMASAYHGHTSNLVALSPYKYNGPGGEGPSDWVHEVPLADDYRGPFKRNDANAGQRYAAGVGQQLDELCAKGRAPAGFLVESLPSVGGQIEFPDGYLREAFDQVKRAGGLCIADEVQVGFGRLGDAFWGFERQAARPDIVVLGKPIANGYPLGAVITTREVADAFNNGMEYFSTFGGNPVACAAGNAVLDVIDDQDLQANAHHQGKRLRDGLLQLQSRYPIIGDVRGRGLFQGIELVRNQASLEPAAEEAGTVVNRLRELHVLAGTDGPLHNVIKLRPPMIVTEVDVDYLLAQLDRALGELSQRA